VALVIPFFKPAEATVDVQATCNFANWTTFNGLNPCQIWGNLQAACVSDVTIPSLNTSQAEFDGSEQQYSSPQGSNATACQCNTVAYNLMAGCTLCQNDALDSIGDIWIDEFGWSEGCPTYDGSGKLPSQASSLQSSIPPWAFTVENGGSWDDFVASSMVAAGATPTPGSDFDPVPDFTGAFDPATIVTGTGTPFPTDSGGDDGDPFDPNDSLTGATGNIIQIIVIIVIVCLVSPLVIWSLVLVVFCVRQRRRKVWYGQIAQYYRSGGQYNNGQFTVLQGQQQFASAGTTYQNDPFATPLPSAGNLSHPSNSQSNLEPTSIAKDSEYSPYSPTPSLPSQDYSPQSQYNPKSYQNNPSQHQQQADRYQPVQYQQQQSRTGPHSQDSRF
jgi:hypothetical protein